MKKIIFLSFIYFTLAIKAFSCSCDTIPFVEATEWADEIFLGRVIQIREVETGQDFEGDPYTKIWVAVFEVEKKWKGSSKKYVEVFQYGTSCEFAFKFRQSYIVYAKENEQLLEWKSTETFQGLFTWLCARNADAYNYNRDYGFDDRPRLDKKYPNLIKVSGFNVEWKWFGIAFATFLIGLIVGIKLKRNKDKNLS